MDAMVAHLEREADVGGYESEDEAAAAVQAAYDSVAGLIGAQRRNVAVVENATEGFFLAVFSSASGVSCRSRIGPCGP